MNEISDYQQIESVDQNQLGSNHNPMKFDLYVDRQKTYQNDTKSTVSLVGTLEESSVLSKIKMNNENSDHHPSNVVSIVGSNLGSNSRDKNQMIIEGLQQK